MYICLYTCSNNQDKEYANVGIHSGFNNSIEKVVVGDVAVVELVA